MTITGKGLLTTYAECHAMGLTLLGQGSAHEIAAGAIENYFWEPGEKPSLRDWDERVHGDNDNRCIGIDDAGGEAIVAWWLAMTESTLRSYQGYSPDPRAYDGSEPSKCQRAA